MATRDVEVAILFSPSTTEVGKFYLAALDPHAFFALYGANTANNPGTHTSKPTLQALRKVVDKKRAPQGEYKGAEAYDIATPAINALVTTVLQRLRLPPSTTWTIEDGRWLRLQTADTNHAPHPNPHPNTAAEKFWL